jgi:outer membrane protein OmpA-like peptidoglycan-associated protein
MNRYPEREIAVEGFTDSVGANEANRRLSERRAAAVKSALVARGVEPSRIDTRGYGAAFPVASNETPDGRQLNRRVEIVINPS